MKFLSLFLTSCISLIATSACAQWQWTDRDGHRVFSDRAPPAEIPDKNILKRPGGTPSPTTKSEGSSTGEASLENAPAAAKLVPVTPKNSGVDKELVDKKKKSEEFETAKRKAEEDIFQQQKAENCQRAKQAKTSFDSGSRIVMVNEKGVQEQLTEKSRAAEVKRIQSIIDIECK